MTLMNLNSSGTLRSVLPLGLIREQSRSLRWHRLALGRCCIFDCYGRDFRLLRGEDEPDQGDADRNKSRKLAANGPSGVGA